MINFDKPSRLEEVMVKNNEGLVEDQEGFWQAIKFAAKHQFELIEEALEAHKPVAEIQELSSQITPLISYLRSKKYLISGNLLFNDDCAGYVEKYDNAVYHIKHFDTERELRHILQEVHDLAHEHDK